MQRQIILMAVVVAVAGLFGAGYWRLFGEDVNPSSAAWMYDGQEWSPSGRPPECEDPLTVFMPVDEDLVTGMLYPGQDRGGSFKPHGGFRFDASLPGDITVRSPVDGYITIAAAYLYAEGSDVQRMVDIHTPCGMMYRFDHLGELSPKLAEALAFLPAPKVGDSRGHFLSEPLKVEQGEVLATSAGFADFEGRPNVFVDFGVYDLRQRNAASQQSSWPADDHGWAELAPYGMCWLDQLATAGLGERLKALPTGNEGTVSAYCMRG